MERQKYLTGLRELLAQRLGEGELRTLCFDMGIDYDDLPGEGKAGHARELIAFLNRRDRIEDLLASGERLYPDIPWDDFLAVTPHALLSPSKPTSERPQVVQTPLIKILFLGANPSNTTRLRLDQEIRAIDEALRQSEFRDRFDIEQQWAVRVADLQGHLLRHKPGIVHFSGHGSASSEIVLEDSTGNSQPVPAHALSALFSVLKDNIRCVVLNACYSEEQARAIAEHIDCVIGMSQAVGDLAAINFATAFYQALGFGRDVQTAFDLGCLQIELAGLDEANTPRLLALRRNPREIVFIHAG